MPHLAVPHVQQSSDDTWGRACIGIRGNPALGALQLAVWCLILRGYLSRLVVLDNLEGYMPGLHNRGLSRGMTLGDPCRDGLLEALQRSSSSQGVPADIQSSDITWVVVKIMVPFLGPQYYTAPSI